MTVVLPKMLSFLVLFLASYSWGCPYSWHAPFPLRFVRVFGKDKAFDCYVVGTNPILKGFVTGLGVKRESWTLWWQNRANTARPHVTSVVSLRIRLFSLHSFYSTVSNEKSDQSIWICESPFYEVFGSNLLFQSRFSEAVSWLGMYLLK